MNSFKKRKFFVFFFLLLALAIPLVWPFSAQADISEDFARKQKEIEELKAKIAETQEKKKTLSSQINLMNQKIYLLSLQIEQTKRKIADLEEEIDILSEKIDRLDVSLERISRILLARVVATYKQSNFDSGLYLLASSHGDLRRGFKYIQAAQKHDKLLLIAVAEAKQNYDQQKSLKQEKQKELIALNEQLKAQNRELEQQKKDKEHLLAVTRNSEANYQRMLANALAELRAIQGIIAGQGKEKKVGPVNEGEKIATVIQGQSACSTGTHLHFEVREGGAVKNPFSYLSSISLINDSGGDDYFFAGNWSWPLRGSIRLTQGFGKTWWVRSGGAPYMYHTGIDIVSNDVNVYSVKKGTLYDGSISCGGGTLFYVRVDHDDSNIDTYYLHVNYAKI